MNRIEIGERLRIAREECMYSRQKAAHYADVGTTTLQQWETGSREASIETIGKLAEVYCVSPQYLIFGDTSHISAPQVQAEEVVDDEYDYIPAYDVEVSAGNGSVCLGEATATKHLAFRKQWLKSRGLNAKSLAALFTKGDSMTPTIPESAVVVINREHTTALDGKVYVIRIDDRHYVKRVQWVPNGGLRLISDNKQYDSFDITKADMQANNIEVCGQVIHASYDLPD